MVMKGKHVMNAWDETACVGESVDEVSDSDKESVNDEENYELNPGSDHGSVINEVNTTNPMAYLLSQASATKPGGNISVRLPCRTEVEVVKRTSSFSTKI